MSSTKLSPAGRRYAALKDEYDHRDFKLVTHPTKPSWVKSVLSKLFPPKKETVVSAEVIDLMGDFGPVKDQGQLSACTGFGYAGYREYIYCKFYENEIDKTIPPEQAIFSPLFQYYLERRLEGTIDQDNGAQMRTGCVVLNQFGIALETEDNYQPKNFEVAPTSQQLADASPYKLGTYGRVNIDIESLKSCIRSGFPIAAGILVYSSFESDAVATSGIVPMPNTSTDQLLGGHCVLFGGFDDEKQLVKCRNSWGLQWGDNGNFYLPYAFIQNALVNDMWTLQL